MAFGLEVEVLGRWGLVGGGLCFFGEDGLRCIGGEGVFRGLLFVAREGDVGAGFEELLPELRVDGALVTGICGPGGGPYSGALPDVLRLLGILLDDGEDAGCDYPVCLAEIVVDLYHTSELVLFPPSIA